MRLAHRYLTSAWGALFSLLFFGCAPLSVTTQSNKQLNCQSLPFENNAGPAWQSVGTHIWLHQGSTDALSTPANRGQISNVVFVLDPSWKGTRGWLLGSGPDAMTGQALACSVRRDLGHEVTDLVSARAHPESVLGAAGLRHLRHWALPEVQSAMADRCERCLKRLETAVEASRPLVDRVSLPNVLIEGKVLGPFDVMPVTVQPQQTIALLHHRASGTWILPGVIWGRDLVPDLRDAEATQLQYVLAELAPLKPQRILPEQGPADDGTLIERNRIYWQHLLDSLQARWHNGDNQPGAASGMTATEWELAGHDARLRDRLNAQRAWQKIENTGFDSQPLKRP